MTTFTDDHIKQLQDLVTCGICSDFYQNPRILPCSHTYCYPCISKTLTNNIFQCPQKDNTNINRLNIADLPVNETMQLMVEFAQSINLTNKKNDTQQCDNCDVNQAVNWCEKCGLYFCQSCTTSIHSNKAFQSHTIIPSVEKVSTFCSEHSDEKFKYWCQKCDILVCRDCLLFQHKDHTFLPLKDAVSEAKSKFQKTAREIDQVRRDLTTFTDTTKRMGTEYHKFIREEIEDIEQKFAHLQQILEKRKVEMINELKQKESQTNLVFNSQQQQINRHLNFTIVQELCLIKILNSNNPIQILKFQSLLDRNYKPFLEQFKQIDQGYTVDYHRFESKDGNVTEISTKISQFGQISSLSHIVKSDGDPSINTSLDLSKVNDEPKLSEIDKNYARGYQFFLKQPFHLRSLRIQSDHIGSIIAFVVSDTGLITACETIKSDQPIVKWLTIPLQCDIKDKYTILIWTTDGNGSYVYKPGKNDLRMITENCSVASKHASTERQINLGSKVSILNNTYSIHMILETREKL